MQCPIFDRIGSLAAKYRGAVAAAAAEDDEKRAKKQAEEKKSKDEDNVLRRKSEPQSIPVWGERSVQLTLWDADTTLRRRLGSDQQREGPTK